MKLRIFKLYWSEFVNVFGTFFDYISCFFYNVFTEGYGSSRVTFPYFDNPILHINNFENSIFDTNKKGIKHDY